MNVSSFRFPLQGAFEHLLRRYILAAVQFNNAAVVERVCITWQHVLGTKARFCNCQIGTCARRHLRYLGVLIQECAKLVAGLAKPAPSKFLVGLFKYLQRSRLIKSRLSRGWRNDGSLCTGSR